MTEHSEPLKTGKMSPDEQIAELRARVEELMRQRIAPAVEELAANAEQAASRARDYTREKADALAGTISQRPLAAVAIAAGIGFLIGRMR